MAMDSNSLHDDIREMRGMLVEMVASQSRTETVTKELKERLYSDAGSIPVLFAKAEKTAAATAKAQAQLDNQKYYVIGLAGGITVTLGFVRFLLGKLGIHI